jgi:hypothetical protein
MLSRKDDWDFHKVQVQKYSKDGRDGTISAFNELIKAGYVKQIRKRDKGKFVGYDYYVSDIPFTEKPNTDNPNTEIPPLVTTQGNNTELSKTKLMKDCNSIPGNSVTTAENLFKKYERGEIELSEIVNYANNK